MNRRGRPPYPDVLTPRQWEVLALLREGLSNEQIALRLGISLDGVKFHVSEILSKLGVTSRNEAAQWEGEQRQPAPTACIAGMRRRCTSPRFGRMRRDRAAINSRGRLSHIREPRCRAHRLRFYVAS
jgi:DNA-binding CsgD family transcriptional regulator